jgi:hypothetical protein
MGKGTVPSSRCARYYEDALVFINCVAWRTWQRPWDEDVIREERYPLFSGSYKRIHLVGDCSSTPVERTGDRYVDSCMYSAYYGMHCTKVGPTNARPEAPSFNAKHMFFYSPIQWAICMNTCGYLEWTSGAYPGSCGDSIISIDSKIEEAVLPGTVEQCHHHVDTLTRI